MSEEQFWHGDIRLFAAFQKAYLRDISYRAWCGGQYNATAFDIVYKNNWSAGKGEPLQYPQWKDPVTKIEEKQLTPKEREHKGRQELINQASWFSNLLNSKRG